MKPPLQTDYDANFGLNNLVFLIRTWILDLHIWIGHILKSNQKN